MEEQLELTAEEPTAVEEVSLSDDTYLTPEELTMESVLKGEQPPVDIPPEDKVSTEDVKPEETPPEETKTEEVPPGDTVDVEEKPTETPPEEKPAEETVTVETAQKQLEEKTKQYDELRTLNGIQTHELGQLRQTVADLTPLLNALNNDPVARKAIYAAVRGESPDNRTPQPEIDYDPNDPESVKTFIANSVKSAVQQQNQEQEERSRLASINTARNNFQASNLATENALISKGHSKEEITKNNEAFFNDFMAGKWSEMAYNHAHLEDIKETARKEGHDEAVKKLQDAGKKPPTLANATTSAPPKDTEMDDLDDMNEEQINKLVNSLPVDHPTVLKIQEGFRSGRFNRFGL